MKLDGEVALVSGGARGMGETHARALLASSAEGRCSYIDADVRGLRQALAATTGRIFP